MTTNTRIKAPKLLNRAAFDLTVDAVATATVNLRKCQAARDARVLVAQASYAKEIAELQEHIKLGASLCEKYAEEHRAELLPDEKKSKSAETPLARFGFRTGNRTLKTLSKWTWEKVLAHLLEEDLLPCVRTKQEVDKEAVLKLAADDKTIHLPVDPQKEDPLDYQLADFGMKVTQDDAFFIEPKIDDASQVKAPVGGAS